jgi:hypothetical protein
MCGFVEQVKVEDRRPGATVTGNGWAARWWNDAVLRWDFSLDLTSTSFPQSQFRRCREQREKWEWG